MEMEGKENSEVLLEENKESDGIQCTERLTKCKDAVCYVKAVDNDNIRHGTGFFARVIIKGIERKCIVTNNHVLPSREIAEKGKAIFYYEYSQPGVEIRLEPDDLFYTNKELDYSFIGCDSDTIENQYCITPLEFSNENSGRVGDDVFIFQHPKGEPKKVSYQKISNIEPPFIYYKADTDIGSSGSPVLRKFQLIAIHSKGCDKEQYNKGSLCSEILNHLNYGIYTQPSSVLNQRYCRKRESSSINRKVHELACKCRHENERKKALNEHGSGKKSKVDLNGLKDPEGQPSEKDLQDLAEDLVNEWKRLGRELEIPNKDISKIHKDNMNYDDIVEKAMAMLLKWKEMKGDSATFGVLKNSLHKIGLVATAMKHC